MLFVKSNILYLRTDLCPLEKYMGGSFAHSNGVIRAFWQSCGAVYIASTKQHCEKNDLTLKMLPLFFLRWKFNYVRWRLESFLSSFIFFIPTYFLCRKNDISMVYQRYSILNFTGALLKKFLSVTFVLEYNASEVKWFKPSAHSPWYERWFDLHGFAVWVEKYNLRSADRVVVVSQVLKDELTKEYGVGESKIVVNPNGVDPEVFMQEKFDIQKINLREFYGFQNKFVFGFIGTFGQWHGVNILRAIIPTLVKKYPQAAFLLIGEGLLKADLENYFKEMGLAGEQVIFTGAIEQERAPEYLAVCDAYLCPTQPNADGSRFFGSPTKLFEYMSMAKPIIASDLEQVGHVVSPAFKVTKNTSGELTVEDRVGFVVDPLDIDGFIRACELCLLLPQEQRSKMGCNAREKVLQNYTWEKHVQRIVDSL